MDSLDDVSPPPAELKRAETPNTPNVPALAPPPGNPGSNDVNTQGSPRSTLYPRSPTLSQFSPAGTRLSMYSNYSGVIQEGTGVSYVVKNTGMSALEETGHDIPGIAVTQGTDSNDDSHDPPRGHSPQRTQSTVVIQTIPNAKPVSRYNTLNTLKASPTPEGQDSHDNDEVPNLPEIPPRGHVSAPVESFKLAVGPPHAIQKNLSIGSGNLASESGSSAYFPFSHAVTEPLLGHSEPALAHEDTASTTSSSIPQLHTYHSGSIKSLTPTRTEVNNVNPAVPQRNKDREGHRSSRSFLDRELNKIETELKSEMHDRDETRATLRTRDGDSYYSAESEDPQEPNDNDDGSATDQYYRNRRVPSNPAKPQSTAPRHSLPHIANVAKTTDEETANDGFEDILDEPISSKPQTNRSQDIPSRSSTARQKQSHKHSKKTSTSSAFDTNTLSQLLMITKGTLVGSEFANLGMQGDEKRALERLVDSLSRLTADMILDPDRYDEGIRRLNNAIKALDGF